MKFFSVILALATAVSVFAEQSERASNSTSELLNLSIRVRADWQGEWNKSTMDDDRSGFKGKYFRMCLEGEIVPGLTYSWRQRFNKGVTDGNFFDATDWLNVNYSIDKWHFSGGKQIVAIGGWEYDRNPAFIYGSSLFWENVPCFQFGAAASFDITPSQNLQFQVCQSMFHQSGMNNIYGYSLLWTGKCDWFSSLWSANLMEYEKGKFISYLSLGSRFNLGQFCLELDLMNRAASHQTFFFRDCSVIGDLSYSTPGNRWRLHAKYSYDLNRTDSPADLIVLPGTELSIAGGGVEFFPLNVKRSSLCLHAACYHSWGHNPMEYDLMHNNSTMVSVGVTWDMNLFKLNRK